MDSIDVKKIKHDNLMKALERKENSFVPCAINGSCATVSYTGQRVVDIMDDPILFTGAITEVFNVMWMDCSIFISSLFSPKLAASFEGCQNYFGPDGTTPEHVQNSPMRQEEYPLLIEDLDEFIYKTLLPRMYPRLYSDRDYAKKAIRVFAEDKFYSLVQLTAMIETRLEEVFGITSICTGSKTIENPLDSIFDRFRGFRGTLTDLRRYPGLVKEAIDCIWEKKNVPVLNNMPASSYPYGRQMPHIPAYLSPKQFNELYWPYEKILLDHFACIDSKCYVMLEGKWANVWDVFKDIKKDVCILHADDDDMTEVSRALGYHQLTMGGLRLTDLRSKTLDELKTEAMRVIDTCGEIGGFIYTTDKSWIAPGDVNQNMIDIFNFVHEYSEGGL